MEGRKKEDWGVITYPLVAFLIFILVPCLPTILILVMKVSPLWLILTLGWAVSWFVGIFVWNDEKGKGDNRELK